MLGILASQKLEHFPKLSLYAFLHSSGGIQDKKVQGQANEQLCSGACPEKLRFSLNNNEKNEYFLQY